VINELGQNSSAVLLGFTTAGCTVDEFECRSDRSCIVLSMVCDGDIDCGDSSDENGDARCGKFNKI